MGALRPDTRLHEYAADAYDKEVQLVANRLRQCATDVERRAAGSPRVQGAMYAITTVGAMVANLQLDRLVQLAHQADPPADTPAVLLDRAAGGVCAVLEATLGEDGDQVDEDYAVQLAEAALRGAGVIR
jgi:hypothetical protein